MNSLQELIEKQASTKLANDLREITTWVRTHTLLMDKTNDNYPFVKVFNPHGGKDGQGEWLNKSIVYVLHTNYSFMQQLRAYWLPIYIKREAEAFVKKVNSLQEQIDEFKIQIDE